MKTRMSRACNKKDQKDISINETIDESTKSEQSFHSSTKDSDKNLTDTTPQTTRRTMHPQTTKFMMQAKQKLN